VSLAPAPGLGPGLKFGKAGAQGWGGAEFLKVGASPGAGTKFNQNHDHYFDFEWPNYIFLAIK
jgi:hypothetical protein